MVNEYRKLLTLLALSVIGAIIASNIVQYAILLVFSGEGFTYLQIWLVNAMIVYASPLVIYSVVFRKHRLRGGRISCSAFDLPLYFFSMYFLCMAANVFSHFVADISARLFGTAPLRDVFENVMPDSTSRWVTMLFFAGIVAPFAEEVIFRHLLLQPLRRFGDAQAVIITAVLFGAFHANATQFLYAAAGGLIFGIVTVRSNSLKPAIILHIANNVLALVLAYFAEADFIVGIVLFAIISIGIVSTIVLMKTGRFKVSNDGEPPGFSAGERAKTVLFHPGVIIMAIVLMITIVLGSQG